VKRSLGHESLANLCNRSQDRNSFDTVPVIHIAEPLLNLFPILALNEIRAGAHEFSVGQHAVTIVTTAGAVGLSRAGDLKDKERTQDGRHAEQSKKLPPTPPTLNVEILRSIRPFWGGGAPVRVPRPGGRPGPAPGWGGGGGT